MLKPAARDLFQIFPDHAGYPDQWFLDDPVAVDGKEIDPRDFTCSTAFAGSSPAALSIANPGRELAFNLGAFDMPIVSTRVADIFRSICTEDVELFSVEISGARESYLILNVLKMFKCLDEPRSEFIKWQPGDHRPDLIGKYHSVWKVRIDAAQAEDAHIFRIEGWKIELIVSKELKQALETVPQLGIIFEHVS
jgi:hypothetical protein